MLTGKQKRYLRALANKLKPVVMIGKDNVTSTIIKSIDEALEAHELIKVSVLKTCELTINEIEIEIIKDCKCELVQTIGKTIVLYRQSKERIITLP